MKNREKIKGRNSSLTKEHCLNFISTHRMRYIYIHSIYRKAKHTSNQNKNETKIQNKVEKEKNKTR